MTLVSVIINMAHALKLNVVAEGVETEEQQRQLRLMHCDEMQGYLFGKPVPVDVFEKKYLMGRETRMVSVLTAPATPG
jgi:EAL domain-containing protein (putative c-di-GMP-specific phosphodiesterase class I)